MINKKSFTSLFSVAAFLLAMLLLPAQVGLAKDTIGATKLIPANKISYTSDADIPFGKEVDLFLIISSFNPESKKTTEYIADFEGHLAESYPNSFRILVEDLAAKNFSEEAWMWKGRVEKVINKYKNRNLKAIIAIGQEAWAALISQNEIPPNVPIFGSFISANGIELPTTAVDETWEAYWINSARKARRKALAGGSIVSYSVYKNIELILSYFPKTKNIVIITDNTYGGASLKAHVKRSIDKMPQVNYIFLDSRLEYLAQLKQKINKLPEESVLLLGAWKVNKNGQFYLPNSLEDLTSSRPDIPVFTLTGTGIENVAIGGYIPHYSHSPANIANQIISFEKGELDSLRFINDGGLYSFNFKKIKEFNISEKTLPLHSRLINVSDPRIQTYKSYLYIISIIAVILSFFIVALSLLYSRNKRLSHRLEKNSKELLEAKEMAEESDRLKSAFLANMSHEIRTPLNSIVGFSNLLTQDDFPNQERQKVSKIIAQNSELLLTLITDILDISGLETGKMMFLLKEANVNDICKQVMATTSYMQKKEIEYLFLPGREELRFKTDVHRLSQVLLNLITNSNKFTDKGSITLAYEVQDNKTILFSVTDTGVGIPVDKHNKLFERFGKLDTFKQGNGLGLAISKQIITRLGGTIWIDPTYTKGARFYFTHPI